MYLPRYLAFLTPFAAAFVFSTGPVGSQGEKRMSAREIFYSAPGETAAAKKATPPQAASPKKQAAGETAKAKPSTPPPKAPPPPSRLQESTEVIPASYQGPSTYPLGIRYSILKREGAESVEVSPDDVFHSGDRIRLRVEANGNGYLYIIHRGSSGVWRPLFPSADIAGGDNRVERGKSYDIPSGYVFTFDEQPGQERLFIVLSRQPEKDLEGLIYSLSSGEKPAEPVKPPEGKLLLAQNMVNIDDGVVNRLRNVYARDLIIEKVDETSAAPPSGQAKEKAVYVVNPARSADSRVVADVALIHK
jgi:hypothetical protein